MDYHCDLQHQWRPLIVQYPFISVECILMAPSRFESFPVIYNIHPILTQPLTRVDSNQPELFWIVICMWTLPIWFDSNQLALILRACTHMTEIGVTDVRLSDCRQYPVSDDFIILFPCILYVSDKTRKRNYFSQKNSHLIYIMIVFCID